ncbi:porin [Parashewanella spongiae]|uniref:Porin n=1 Tax=Parashewanella spongiae TaxID=342950 RepID=A0A3A6TCZ1_9GAMM|nr:porin [Parashewanella spongiae]MCL1078635.1 porin [Parashewanella spongiae]RJY12972.1 porin [Parashewanella spongiae]
MSYQKFKLALLPLALTASMANAADVSKEELQQQLNQIQSRLAELELAKPATDSKTVKAVQETKHSLNFYGTLRPTFGVTSTDEGSKTDVGDALSRIGIATEHKLKNGLTAFAKSEFKVNIQANGDFGEARKAYVGVKGDFGRFAIGKQASTQYNMIADPVDIFNRASTPLAYDSASPFRVNNLVTYRKQFGDVKFTVDAQFDGSDGDAASDLFNTGVQYSANGLKAAVAYYTRERGADDESTIGFSVAKSFGDLYLATSYQDRTVDLADENVRQEVRGDQTLTTFELAGSTIDVVAAYKINDTYKAKFGVSMFEDGDVNGLSGDYEAYNATLEYHASSDFYMFAEYQRNDFDNRLDENQFNIGLRYNFDVGFKF